MDKMNILQIVPYFLPYQGGQERHIYHLSKELIKKGHRVTIITSNYPISEKSEIFEGIQILRHKCFFRPLRNPITPTMLKRFNQLKDFDLIHIHNEHSFSSNVAAIFKYHTKKPLVITCHGQLKFNNYFKDGFELLYNRTFGRFVFNKTDRIIALSNSDKEYISSLGVNSKKIHVIPNAVDLSNFSMEIDSANYNNFINTFGLKNKKVILFVGPLIRRKGVEYLLKSIQDVANQFDDVVFLFVGGGDYLNNAMQQSKLLEIEEYVCFTGAISDLELLYAYKSSDIFVLPSVSEGLPTTILEAFSFALPVISTDIPGVRDHFKDYALLVPPYNSGDLAMAIKKLLGNSDLANTLGQNGKNLVESQFTWDNVATQIENMYYELVDTK